MFDRTLQYWFPNQLLSGTTQLQDVLGPNQKLSGLAPTTILSATSPVAPQFTPPSQREKVRLASKRCYTEQSKTYMIDYIVIMRLDKEQEKEFIFSTYEWRDCV